MKKIHYYSELFTSLLTQHVENDLRRVTLGVSVMPSRTARRKEIAATGQGRAVGCVTREASRRDSHRFSAGVIHTEVLMGFQIQGSNFQILNAGNQLWNSKVWLGSGRRLASTDRAGHAVRSGGVRSADFTP